ncbi:Bacterial mobilisation protein (MobC) [Neisseria gonorrhoeae]|uniref:Bacterial mobilisation protein (MobC) n=3 Tax=Neisseria gonorrhoeae TaxID=485 RepID=A0A379B1P3_NEIGO|nr:Bacterial mobilisation protein (MobC) [Neisseria gonorrhoeae]
MEYRRNAVMKCRFLSRKQSKQGYFALLTGSSAAEKRTKQLIIRVSPTEFETLTRQKTHPNLARYIRERVLEDGKASDKKTVKFQFPPEVVRVLAGMGNNLNQIAKALNTAAKVGTLGNVEALKATTELAALERSLNSLRDF